MTPAPLFTTSVAAPRAGATPPSVIHMLASPAATASSASTASVASARWGAAAPSVAPTSASTPEGIGRVHCRFQLTHTKSGRPLQSIPSAKVRSCSASIASSAVPWRISATTTERIKLMSPAERRKSTPRSPIGSSYLASSCESGHFANNGIPSRVACRKHKRAKTAYLESTIVRTKKRVLSVSTDSARPRGNQCAAMYAMALGVGTHRYSNASNADQSGGSARYRPRRAALGTEKNSVLCHMWKKSSTQRQRSWLSCAASSPHRARFTTLYQLSNGLGRATKRTFGAMPS